MTCKKLESLSGESITGEFAEQLKSGLVEWRVVNTDRPENQHFTKDYQLTTRSLVIVKFENGKQTGFKNLQEIWKLAKDGQAFRNYVSGEVRVMLGQS